MKIFLHDKRTWKAIIIWDPYLIRMQMNRPLPRLKYQFPEENFNVSVMKNLKKKII